MDARRDDIQRMRERLLRKRASPLVEFAQGYAMGGYCPMASSLPARPVLLSPREQIERAWSTVGDCLRDAIGSAGR